MKISFKCPSGHRLKARPDKAGTNTVCPACGVEVLVPQMELRPGEVPIQAAPAPTTTINSEASTGEVPLAPPPSTTSRDTNEASQTVKRPPLAPSTIRSKWAEESAANKPAGTTPPPLRGAGAATRENGNQGDGGKAPPPLPSRSVQAPPLSPGQSSAQAAGHEIADPMAITSPPAAATSFRAEPRQPRTTVRGYRPDQHKLASVYWLALALLAITLVELIPAISQYVQSSAPFFTFTSAPSWAHAVLVLCMLQIFYIVWMVTLPDWSTVWTMTLVYGVASAAYGFVFAVSLLTAHEKELMLQLDTVRWLTPMWSAAMVLLTFLAAFLSGRAGTRWHRAYMAMVKGMGA